MSSASQSSIRCSKLAYLADISDSLLSAVIAHIRTWPHPASLWQLGHHAPGAALDGDFNCALDPSPNQP